MTLVPTSPSSGARMGSGAWQTSPGAASCSRIGGHTVTQVAEVLRDWLSDSFAEAVLRDATRYTLTSLPTTLIDEREPQALVRALVYRLGAKGAASVLREAGVRTSRHLLAHGIPQLLQVATRIAPRPLALRMLLDRMVANAWNFAGSGQFSVSATSGVPELLFEHCAMCRDMHASQPMCDFYAGALEHVFRQLIAPGARVREVECMAHGGEACRFRLTGV
ncbi:MAG TPA: bacteriochlorophyll 4-vinyl reductase [Gemmatimonadaceae bacterium]|nr:bacteriochlorophyll 4-vinyl reductase [Gemmatimonadaceae bacterium]